MDAQSDPLDSLILEPILRDYPEQMALADRMAMHGVPGVSVAGIEGGQLTWARAYGVRGAGGSEPVTSATRFQAGSISKAVTATAVMRLVQEGRLDLDEDVNAYLQSWRVPPNGDWQPRITLRQLLSHSAGTTIHGFLGYAVGDVLPGEVETLEGIPPANTRGVRVTALPGTQFRYSGGGTVIVQLLLADVLGKAFPHLMRDLVLGPLGMTNSSFEQPATSEDPTRATGHHIGRGIVHGRWRIYPEMAAAGLWTTPSDLASWLADLMRAYRGESGTLLSQQSLRIMTAPQIEQHVGLGLFLHGSGVAFRFGHEGDTAGFQAEAFGYPVTNAGFSVMANSDMAYTLRQDIVRTLAAAYGWSELAPKPLPQVPMQVENGLAGIYRLKDGELQVRSENGTLLLVVPTQEPVQLVPQGGEVYLCLNLNAEVVFQRGGDGVVHGLLLRQEGQETLAQRLRDPVGRWPGAL